MSFKKLFFILFSLFSIVLTPLCLYQGKVSAYTCGYLCDGTCNSPNHEASAVDCHFEIVTYYSTKASCKAGCGYY
jgi:hypothetical protein